MASHSHDVSLLDGGLLISKATEKSLGVDAWLGWGFSLEEMEVLFFFLMFGSIFSNLNFLLGAHLGYDFRFSVRYNLCRIQKTHVQESDTSSMIRSRTTYYYFRYDICRAKYQE